MLGELAAFTRGSPCQSVTIIIGCDTMVEDSESFVARISVNAALYPGVRLAPDTAIFYIVCPDGKTLHNLW